MPLEEYARLPQVHLEIYSHAYAPPLQPSAGLKYDLRRISNPPKQIRDSFDGRSKRIQEFLSHDQKFQDLLDLARNDMEKVVRRTVSEIRHAEPGIVSLSTTISAVSSNTKGNEEPSEDKGAKSQSFVLRISCFCERGRHRSVAFAESLAATKWPCDWNVELIHRDLEQSKQRSSKNKSRRRTAANDPLGYYDDLR